MCWVKKLGLCQARLTGSERQMGEARPFPSPALMAFLMAYKLALRSSLDKTAP